MLKKKLIHKLITIKKKHLADLHIQNIEMLSTKKIVKEFIEKFF